MTTKPNPGISKALLGCLVLAIVLVVLLGGGAVFLMTQLPPVAEQAPVSLAPLVVTITNPAEGTELTPNEPLRITAEALGAQPITALELWVDGVLVQVQGAPPNSDQKQFGAAWSWSLKTDGIHTLLARAKDAGNNVGNSNIVQVTVARLVSDPQVGIYKAQPGDTVKAIAAKVKADAQQIIDLNPKLGLDTALPAGSPVTVPVAPGGPADPAPGLITSSVPPLPPSETSGAKPTPVSSSSTPVPTPTVPSGPVKPVDSPPGKTTFWINRNVLGRILPLTLATPPKAPALAGEASSCSVRLFISDQSSNEDGFFVYRLGPADTDFSRVATIPANGDSLPLVFTDSVSMGNYEYYVSAFNGQGEAPSNYVAVNISLLTCLLPGDADLWFDNLKLTPSQPTDKAYCYASVGDGPWMRLPTGIDVFLTPKGGVFDLSKYVGGLAVPAEGLVLNFECWGWQGGKLNYIGKGAGKIDPAAKTPFTLDTALFHIRGAGSLRGPVALKPRTLEGKVSNIAPPTGLARTLNPSTCADHWPGLASLFGAMLCKASIEKGDLVLIWNWKPASCGAKPCIADIEGFHIYNVSGKTPVLVRTVKPKDWIGQVLPAVKVTTPPTCFVVTAFKGKDDSLDSNKLCIGPSPAPVKKITLKPTGLETMGQSSHVTSDKVYCSAGGILKLLLFAPLAAIPTFDTSGLGGSGWSIASETSSVAVGYDYHRRVGTEPFPCPEGTSQFYRGLIYFDLSKTELTAKTPLSNVWLNYHDAPGAATFRVDEADDDTAGGVDATGLESCVGDIYIADVLRDRDITFSDGETEGFTNLAFLTTQWGESRSAFDVPKIVDARNAVRQWLTNKREGVFMFTGFSEKLDPPNSDACLGRYDRFSLDIEYFPEP